MNKISKYIVSILILQWGCNSVNESEYEWIDTTFEKIESQVELAAERNIPDPYLVPRSIENDGSLKWVDREDWTSGFFPAILWQLYDVSENEKWKEYAEKWMAGLEENKFNDESHDLGFMMYLPYGKAWQHTSNETYKEIALQSAETLATRYNSDVGMIRSWDFTPGDKNWQYPVIIDNMMNLELLFWAAEVSGEDQYFEMAKSHAEKSIERLIRDDGSSYHVVDVEPEDGSIRWQGTHQGLHDESYWSRGQAWGLYGFTMAYRETGEQKFLDTAKEIADFFLNNLPEDLIPYWDFSDPEIPDAPRDVSAGTIAASAYIELSDILGSEGVRYLDVAERMLKKLSEEYMPKVGENHNFILTHSTGNKPGGYEIGVPLVYADYYFIEALKRLREVRI